MKNLTTIVRASLFFGAATLVAACSGTKGTGTGTEVATGGGGGGETSTSGSSGSGSVSDSRGYLIITQSPGSFFASFVENSAALANDDCVTSTVAECSIKICPNNSNPTKPIYAGAGALSVTGLLDQNGKATYVGPIPPEADLQYKMTTWSGTEKSFAGGETITVKATGGQVPAFSISATAPYPIEVTTPDPGGPITLSASSDFPVTWMTASDGTVYVTIFSDLNDDVGKTGSATLSCTFQADYGKGVVPAAAIQKLLAAPGINSKATINVVTSNAAMVNAGGFSIAMSVSEYALVQSFTIP